MQIRYYLQDEAGGCAPILADLAAVVENKVDAALRHDVLVVDGDAVGGVDVELKLRY